MHNNLEEKQILDIFQELLDKYDIQGSQKVRDGHTRVSVFGRQCRFDLSKSFPLLTHRQHFARAAFEEVMWYLRGQTDNQILKDKAVHVWDQWEGQIDPKRPTELGKIYGHMFRNFGATNLDHITRPYTTKPLELVGFDQIEWLLNEIKTNPTSSRLILSNWDPEVSTQTPKEAVLPCCLTLMQFHVEDMTLEERYNWLDQNYEGTGLQAVVDHHHSIGSPKTFVQVDYEKVCDFAKAPKSKLSCMLYQRSSDCSVAGGWNVTQISLLTLLLAQQCGLEPGEFIWNTGNIHLYGNQIDDVCEMVSRETHPFPQIKINKAKDLYSYEWSDIEITGYQHSGKIENLKVAL